MSRMSVFSSPYMLGFDEMERLLDHAAKSAGDGYPPYNIEKIASNNDDGEDVLRITLAVAGFSLAELEITLEENQLIICGRQQDEVERDYLHRGIAARQFKRTFVLAQGMIVKGADIENGLLTIDVVRPQPAGIVQNIAIKEK